MIFCPSVFDSTRSSRTDVYGIVPIVSDPIDVQSQVLKLVEIATRAPESEEGRTAAVLACRLIRHHGFFIVRSDELVTFVTEAPAAPAPVTPPKRTRKRRRGAAEEDLNLDVAARPVDEILSGAAGEILSGAILNVLRGNGRR